MLWYEVAGNVLYYVTLPIVKIVFLFIYVLRAILSPVIYIATIVVQLLLIPYNIAAKFEAVWYFLAGAVLIGAVSAVLVHGILRIFVFIFRLDRKHRIESKDTPTMGHDVHSYREARERKKTKAEKEQAEIEVRAKALANSPLLKEALKSMQRGHNSPEDYNSPSGHKKKEQPSWLDQTIIEHTSEEDS